MTFALKTHKNAHPLLGDTVGMQALQADIDSASSTDAKVLLTGETGVGKEVVAHNIHLRSRRQAMPFVTVNCAGVPDSLLESEFFGFTRGSFTGAYRDSPGLLRQAHTGTVFLDEVGEMSLRMQALLLRFLETGEIQPIGGTGAPQKVDARVITATNRNLLRAVTEKEFREDLYYRLNVFHVHIPPLRDRAQDVPLLVDHFVQVFAEQHRQPPPVLATETIELLTAYHWPGNIRELKNVVERLVLKQTARIEPAHLPGEIVNTAPEPETTTPHANDGLSHASRVQGILDNLLLHRQPFWTVAYKPFMSRDITRDDLRFIVRAGLEQTKGSYRALMVLFNMETDDYKRFLSFLKTHECHLPFQGFRTVNASMRTRAFPAGCSVAS